MFFSKDKSIDNLQALFTQVKEWLALQKELTLVTLTEKLTLLLSAIALTLVVIILGAMGLFYLSFTLAYMLEPVVGGLTQSFAIISAALFVLALLVYLMRGRLIYRPITSFIAQLLLTPKEEEQDDEE